MQADQDLTTPSHRELLNQIWLSKQCMQNGNSWKPQTSISLNMIYNTYEIVTCGSYLLGQATCCIEQHLLIEMVIIKSGFNNTLMT